MAVNKIGMPCIDCLLKHNNSVNLCIRLQTTGGGGQQDG